MTTRKNKRARPVALSQQIKFGRKLLSSRDGATLTALWAMRALFKSLSIGPRQ